MPEQVPVEQVVCDEVAEKLPELLKPSRAFPEFVKERMKEQLGAITMLCTAPSD